MNVFSFLVPTFVFFGAAQSWACDRETTLVCAGDPAVTAGNNLGRVIAVNRRTRMVSIRIEQMTGNPATVGDVTTQDLRSIGIGVGCTYDYCVGDGAVTLGNNRGKIVGVKPFSHEVSIQITRMTGNPAVVGSVVTQDLRSIGLERGCVDGYCIGDLAVTAGNNLGEIVSINPYAKTVSIQIQEVTGNPAQVGQVTTQSIDQVSIERECLEIPREHRRGSRPREVGEFDFEMRETVRKGA